MSSAARLVLTNSSLSSLPMFAMGLFLLAEGVHASLDTPRARFFGKGRASSANIIWSSGPSQVFGWTGNHQYQAPEHCVNVQVALEAVARGDWLVG